MPISKVLSALFTILIGIQISSVCYGRKILHYAINEYNDTTTWFKYHMKRRLALQLPDLTNDTTSNAFSYWFKGSAVASVIEFIILMLNYEVPSSALEAWPVHTIRGKNHLEREAIIQKKEYPGLEDVQLTSA